MENLKAIQDFFGPIPEPVIIFISTLLALYLKELLDRKRSAKQEAKEKLETAKVYADPLLLSMVNLLKRLQELFEGDARFLKREARKRESCGFLMTST